VANERDIIRAPRGVTGLPDALRDTDAVNLRTLQTAMFHAATILNNTAWDYLGDMIVGAADNVAVRLPIGTAGQVLTVVGGTAAWAASTGGTGDDTIGWVL